MAASSSSLLPLLSSPGSDGPSGCTDSSSDVLVSSVAVPLSLSLSPALSPEEFERVWLQRQASHAERGNEIKPELPLHGRTGGGQEQTVKPLSDLQ